MGADAAGGPVVGTATLDADVGGAGDLDDGSQGQPALAESALKQVARALEADDESLVGHRFPFLERLPAGQSPHPVFRDFHVTAATEQRVGGWREGKSRSPVARGIAPAEFRNLLSPFTCRIPAVSPFENRNIVAE